jgi:branched-chain amino acid transport system ATP-binding protein
MLRVEALSAFYGPVRALDGVSLDLPAGRVVCLLGANGAGKTTMLNCISGLVRPSAGRIVFEGEDITRLAPHRIVARGILQVPEGREIFPSLSVADNLALGAWTRRGRGAATARARVFDLFPRLAERARQAAGTLSGGEQQMLMIGRALMCEPKVLLFDEPSLGLSPVAVEHVFALIARLNGGGVPILLVEQNARLALAASDFGYILENGAIRLHGPSAELARNPEMRAAYLGGD